MKTSEINPRIKGAFTRAKMALKDKQLKAKQKGLTTVEYAIAGSLVGLAVVGAFTALGNAVGEVITNITNVIT